MQHKSIQYWETFSMPDGGWRKLVIETLLEENDNPRDAFYAGQKEIRNFHFESKNHDKKQLAETNGHAEAMIGVVDDVVALINKCTTIPKPNGIMVYEIMAKTDSVIKEAYDKKLAELSGDEPKY